MQYNMGLFPVNMKEEVKMLNTITYIIIGAALVVSVVALIKARGRR
ncbi:MULTISPECIES: hypothetical protein [Paenibacillus]|jgi:uncharacterized membrane protein YuzA (DUF378 family)|nr:hypothetical protein [Paenibacillus odorifer]MEC0131565.1 hypothetical protein [Paenibacillus odorifer]MEC0220282.1 hypothetical protein [Paenibacillus odorifer]